jgi:hypothetical protein
MVDLIIPTAMKKILFLIITLFFFYYALAQADFTGNYHFQSKIYVHKDSPSKPGKDEAGRMGDLQLLKIDSVKYKFWLSVNKGWPGYHQGDVDGIVEIRNGKGIFKELQEYSESPCILKFAITNKYTELEQSSTDSECGFGASVYADGKYPKRNNHRLTNKELQDQYIDIYKYRVIAEKAFLYEDSSGNKIKKQYFIKDDIVICPSESEGFIYAEYITPSGKFIYGWIPKSELKETK